MMNRTPLRRAAAPIAVLTAIAPWLPAAVHAASAHDRHAGRDAAPEHHGSSAAISDAEPTLGGEYAFATIAEIVALLKADPATDWNAVDVPALREHLRDMSRVTLDADVVSESTERGATFRVTSDDRRTVGSIRRMVADHARTMGDAAAWRFEAREIDGGMRVEASGGDDSTASMIRALGFHGLMADGDHHRVHHWMLATGADPH